mgnify:CR=1 FL=1
MRIEVMRIGHEDDCGYGVHPWWKPLWWCHGIEPKDLWVGLGDLHGRPVWAFSVGMCNVGVINMWRY